MPCPQCKRRAGYTIIEDTSRCDDIYAVAFTFIHADQVAKSSVIPLNAQAFLEKNWWAAAAEGSLSTREIEGLETICAELGIDNLIAVLPGETAQHNLIDGENKVSLGLAFVETNADALRNFCWDFPSSFVLFPTTMQFVICQYEHPAVLAAGAKSVVERLFNLSIEAAIEQFKEDMQNSESETFAAYLIENVIEPVNNSATNS
jgi:hypothetical protein